RRLVAYLKDDTGVLELTWFKSFNWIEKVLKTEAPFLVFGKVGFFMGKPQMVHPEMELVQPVQNGTRPRLDPVYPSTEKLKSKSLGGRQLGKLTEALFLLLKPGDLPENLPSSIL